MLYEKYFKETMSNSINKYGKTIETNNMYNIPNTNESRPNKVDQKSLKNADLIRIQNLDTTIKENKQYIFEFILVSLFHDLLKGIHKKTNIYTCHLYTIVQLRKSSIYNINKHVLGVMQPYLDYVADNTDATKMIRRSYEYIEQNNYLLKYQAVSYTHLTLPTILLV